MMMKKIVAAIVTVAILICFLGVVGSVGAFENDMITGGRAVVQGSAFILAGFILGALDYFLMGGDYDD